MSSILKVNTIQDTDGNNIINENANTVTIGKSGDTVTVASGATFVGGGIQWQSSIVTAATHTAGANQGLWLDTSSNTITLTLPASPSVGDQVVLVDYARNWGTNAVTVNRNGSNFQGGTLNPTYSSSGQVVDLVFSGSTKGWIPNLDKTTTDKNAYDLDFLVIAGGGGGGYNNAGGGGGGGMRASTQNLAVGVAITVTVGNGGAGGTPADNQSGQGVNSSISATGLTTITSAGGGNASSGSSAGGDGGSGGGGGYNSGPGGSGNTPATVPSQGADGGAGVGSGTPPAYGAGGGGGGGASGSNGVNGTSTKAGNGGAGSTSTIEGASITYAGGGGGAADNDTPSSGDGGSGGGGPGAAGGGNPDTYCDGTTNKGGGGGGHYQGPSRAGNGGTGVVIISVPDGSYSGTTTGSPTITTNAGGTGKTVMKFTGSGSYTT